MASIRSIFLRLLGILGLLTLTRFIFLGFHWDYYQNLSTLELLNAFRGGLRFDLSTLCLTNSLYLILLSAPGLTLLNQNKSYQRITELAFIIPNSIAVILNCIDMGFFPFTRKRITADFFLMGGLANDLKSLASQYLLDYWYLAVIACVLIYLIHKISAKNKTIHSQQESITKHLTLRSIHLAIALSFIIIGTRGGLQSRPIRIASAIHYGAPSSSALIINTPSSIFTTLTNKGLKPLHYFEDNQEMLSYFNSEHHFRTNEPFKKLNVVILILESFAAEFVGALNKDKPNYTGYTPFLDSIIEKSKWSKGYANGTKSILACPTILAGIPSLMNDTFITSIYASNQYNALPKLLKPLGYTSAFFHGGRNGTMAFDTFAKAAGFDHYIGMSEYPNPHDYDGNWGIYDELFLKFCAEEIDQYNKPFIATIFTLSSHHPYNVPEELKAKLPQGTVPIHSGITYADYALKQFFKSIENKDWYNDTLFVLVADHSTWANDPEYQKPNNRERIPIIFYHPGNSNLQGEIKGTTEQADIMPSILEYLNYNKPFIAFGESIFSNNLNKISIMASNDQYEIRHGEQSITLSKEQIGNRQEAPYKRAQSILEQYHTRMLNNTLTVDN